MKGALSIWGRNTTVSNHRSLFLVLVILPAILCLTGPLWADAWEPVIPSGSVPGARAGHSMVLIGGKVYMFGGEGNSGAYAGEKSTDAVVLNDLWYLEQESEEWKKLNPQNTPPKARKNHAAVAYGEKMFVFFGVGDQGYPLGDIWAYDVASNNWQEVITKGDPPVPTGGQSVVYAYGHFYLFGGKDRYNNVYSSLYSLDPKDGYTWKYEGDFDKASENHRTMANDTTMYVYGGDNGQLVNDQLWAYNFATKGWTIISTQTKPTGRTCHIATLDGNKIRTQGGRDQTNKELGDTWEYDIVSNQWVRKADGPVQSRSAAVGVGTSGSSESISASVQAASYILMFGGERGGQFLDEMWKYTSSSNAPKSTPAINLLILD